jgi:FtsH-binding integral membrane protein
MHYPDEYQGFVNDSKQQKSQIDFDFYNKIYDWSAIVLILVALICLYRKPNPLLATFFAITALFILCNAFSTACFANVLARLNARDFWILPMLSIGIIVQYFYPNNSNRESESQ